MTFEEWYRNRARSGGTFEAKTIARDAWDAATKAAREWQPIETAPRDGTHFSGVVDGEVRCVMWGKTSHLPWRGFILVDQGVECADLCDPTRWMPLPQPPEAK